MIIFILFFKNFLLITLKVMLIRDISAMNEAVSLSVLGGSLSDPRDMQGLAHYLEHSVFLGSKVFRFPPFFIIMKNSF